MTIENNGGSTEEENITSELYEALHNLTIAVKDILKSGNQWEAHRKAQKVLNKFEGRN